MVKTFEDLIHEVHEKNICQQCGGCVSFCSSAEFDVIGFKDPFEPPEYINEDQCLECGICYYICPQTHVLDSELNQAFNFSGYDSMLIGSYKDVYSCQATDKKFLSHGTDGGVVNSVINYLIEKKNIDGAIVSKTKSPFSREATFASSKETLLNASGAQFNISPHLNEIQKFSTYPHTIPELNHYKFKKLAVVGTPCQLYTIRCMQELGVTPSENIGICLGLFCYENFCFDKSQIEKFERDFNIEYEDIEKINIKKDVVFKLKDEGQGGKTIHIPFNHLKDYMRDACKACNDFPNIYSDISFGGLGSPEKYTTVIPRTDIGMELFQEVLNAGIIECRNVDQSVKEKMLSTISQFSKKKIQRKSEFMKTIKSDGE
ncbi:MAG: Coenzyme F420 hydrogenase/dehydrogenase, beta subunit C-terminal domain [Promethearchaeia archaeon]